MGTLTIDLSGCGTRLSDSTTSFENKGIYGAICASQLNLSIENELLNAFADRWCLNIKVLPEVKILENLGFICRSLIDDSNYLIAFCLVGCVTMFSVSSTAMRLETFLMATDGKGPLP